MAYTLKLSNGTILLSLPDQHVDNISTSLTLIGKNVNSYGTAVNDNFIRLLENFSSGNYPNSPLVGQLWFDTVNQQIKVYTSFNEYKAVGTPTISAVQPVTFAPGDLWFDTVANQMKLKVDNSTIVVISNGGSYNLPVASSVILGGVKIGDGLLITPSGVISTSNSSKNITSKIIDGVMINGLDINGFHINAKTIKSSQIYVKGSKVVTEKSLPIATYTTLGLVKIGSGISITTDGTISSVGGSGGGTTGPAGAKGDTGTQGIQGIPGPTGPASSGGVANISAFGYAEIHSGLYVQWGNCIDDGPVRFPIAFPNNCFSISGSGNGMFALPGNNWDMYAYSLMASDLTKTGFTNNNPGPGGGGYNQTQYYIAIGN